MQFPISTRVSLIGIAALACCIQNASVGASSAGPAANWPMYRGSSGLVGIAAGRLPEALVLSWSFKTEGPVKSSAAIVGGRVYVGSDDGNVYAPDLRSE